MELARELNRGGYKTVLTRKDDRLLSPFSHYRYKNQPYKRDDIKRRLNKLETAGTEIILSVHVNWHHSAHHRGPIAYYAVASPDSRDLANSIQKAFNHVQPYRKMIRTSDCFLLCNAKRPVVLIELGFFSNDQDCKDLSSKDYRGSLIKAIISGLEDYDRQRTHRKSRLPGETHECLSQ